MSGNLFISVISCFSMSNFDRLDGEKVEIVIKSSKDFVDERGKIANYELTEKVNWIGLITSKKGTLRANHYHPEQEQKVLLISGKYISVFKDLSKTNSEIKHHLITTGDLVITPPNVAHTMIFLDDSVLINLVNGEREHEKFGQHTIPHQLVDPKNFKEIENYASKYVK